MSTESKVTADILGALDLAAVVSWRTRGGHLANIYNTLSLRRSVLLSLKGSDFTDRSDWSSSTGASDALVRKSDTTERNKVHCKQISDKKGKKKIPEQRVQRITLIYKRKPQVAALKCEYGILACRL